MPWRSELNDPRGHAAARPGKLGHASISHSECRERASRSGKLRCGRRAFQRDHQATGPRQPTAKTRQPGQRRNGTGGDDISDQTAGQILSPLPDDNGIAKPELGQRVVKERDPPLHRLDESHPAVGQQQGENHAWQPGTGPYIDHRCADRHQRGNCRAVEQMPLPHPPGF